MISARDLRKLAKGRLEDAEVLRRGNRYDGTVYLCGYAVELALKARICKTLKWSEFPDDNTKYRSLRTHDLEVLLHLSGIEAEVAQLKAEWSIVMQWNAVLRYRKLGTATVVEAGGMIGAARNLLKVL
jgi:hypothetical protein